MAGVRAIAEGRAKDVFQFYRAYFKALFDALLSTNIEETHLWLDELIDHLVASIVADTIRKIEHEEKR